MFPQKKCFAPLSPGTLNHMLLFNFVASINCIMSHHNYLTGNPTPPAAYSCYPVPLSFPLSMRTFQLCILFLPLFSPTTLKFPLYLGRDYLLVRLFLAFCAVPRRIHIRPIILFSASFSLGYPLYFCLLFLLRLQYSYSLYKYCQLSFRFCFWLRLCSTPPLFSPISFGPFTISYLLPPYVSIYSRTSS